VRSQSDFGVFDPRFFGIQVSMDSSEAASYFLKAYQESPLPYDGADPYMDQKLWLGTVVEHETKHYHDALISPYSSKLLRLRRNIIFNFDQVFTELFAGLAITGANCIPVPLQNWLERDASAREQFINQMNNCAFFPQPLSALPLPIIPNMIDNPIDYRDLGRKVSFDVYPATSLRADVPGLSDEGKIKDMFSDDQSQRRMGIIKDHYDQIDFLLRGMASRSGVDLEPWEIFEMTAVMVQAGAAEQTFTNLTAREFLLTFVKANPTYLRLIVQFLKLAKSGETQVGRTLGMVGFWSMCTGVVLGNKFYRDWSDADGHACTTKRFLSAMSYVQKHGLAAEKMSARAFLNALDAAAGCPTSWDENLAIGQALNKMAVERAQQYVSEDATSRMKNVISAFERFVDQQSIMLDLLKDILEEYVDPGKYLYIVNTLPKPPSLLGFGPHAIMRENEFLNSPSRFPIGKLVVSQGLDELGEKWVSEAILCEPGDEAKRHAENCWIFYDECRKLDYIFCKHHRSEPEGIEFTRYVPKNNLNYVELFD
jgi:hypothetical protein